MLRTLGGLRRSPILGSDAYADRVRKLLELRLEDGEQRIVVEWAEAIS